MPHRVPARGRYDRTSSASARAQQQHDVLLAAALELLFQGNIKTELSVSALCDATGMGRNTVYGLFESADVIAETVIGSCLAAARAALAEQPSRAPLAAAAEFVHAWLAFAASMPVQLVVAARWSRAELAQVVHEALRELLELGRSAGLFAADPSGTKTLLLGAAAIEAGLYVATHPSELDSARASLLELITRYAR